VSVVASGLGSAAVSASTSPVLWYLNRGSGVVLLLLLTLTVLLGVLATGRTMRPWWPRFVTQGLHRALAALTMGLLAGHVVSAVVDEFVDIRWWQAFSPLGATYEPFWLGLGTLSLDLLLLVVVTSVLRDHLPQRVWFATHLLTYAAWALSVVHGLGIGTDAGRGWLWWPTLASVVLVVTAGVARLVMARARRGAEVEAGTEPAHGIRTSGVEELERVLETHR